MNRAHLEVLASPWWANYLETELLPWALGATDLGDDVLEVGPGPGHTTDLLHRQVPRLTAVEVDGDLTAALAERLAGTNVEVVHADATKSGLPTDRFSAATCFTMLHHVPSSELQDRLFAEVCRVLRAGGTFIGTDSIDSDAVRQATSTMSSYPSTRRRWVAGWKPRVSSTSRSIGPATPGATAPDGLCGCGGRMH
jgi:SAM-dependent methyltransferase